MPLTRRRVRSYHNFAAGGGGGGPTFVQGAYSATPSTNDSPSLALNAMPGNVTVGNRVIVLVAHSYMGCPPSVTDSLGNAYTMHSTQDWFDGVSGITFSVFSAPVTTGGACTVTIHAGCGQLRRAFALEYSGANGGFDGKTQTNNTTSNSLTTGSVTTTVNGDLVLSLFLCSTVTATYTPGGGATQHLYNQGDMVQGQIQSTAGAIAGAATVAGFTVSGAAPIPAGIACFKAG